MTEKKDLTSLKDINPVNQDGILSSKSSLLENLKKLQDSKITDLSPWEAWKTIHWKKETTEVIDTIEEHVWKWSLLQDLNNRKITDSKKDLLSEDRSNNTDKTDTNIDSTLLQNNDNIENNSTTLEKWNTNPIVKEDTSDTSNKDNNINVEDNKDLNQVDDNTNIENDINNTNKEIDITSDKNLEDDKETYNTQENQESDNDNSDISNNIDESTGTEKSNLENENFKSDLEKQTNKEFYRNKDNFDSKWNINNRTDRNDSNVHDSSSSKISDKAKKQYEKARDVAKQKYFDKLDDLKAKNKQKKKELKKEFIESLKWKKKDNNTLEKKWAFQIWKQLVVVQLQGMVLWILTSISTVLLPYILIFLVLMFLIMTLYIVMLALSSMNNPVLQTLDEQKKAAEKQQTQSWVTVGEELVSALSDGSVTMWGPGTPMWTPMNWRVTWSLWRHISKEGVYALDISSPKKDDEPVRSTMAWEVLYISKTITDPPVMSWWQTCKSLVPGSWWDILARWWGVARNAQLIVVWNKDTGYVTLYLHESTTNQSLNVWDTVGYWTTLWQQWTTWCSTWHHVHYEIRHWPIGWNWWDKTKWKYIINGYSTYWYNTVSPDEYIRLMWKVTWELTFDEWAYSKYNVIQKTSTIMQTVWSELVNTTYWPLNWDRTFNICQTSPSTYTKQTYPPIPQTVWLSKQSSIIWTTERERIQSMLKTYFATDFQNIDDWYKAASESELDVSLLVCIWRFESSWWNRLTTKYNIWNVGNTDGWARRNFSSPMEWIKAMWDRAFNGTYLKPVQSMVWLSVCKKPSDPYWYWGQWYASDIEWVPKIVGCMSQLKNKNIPVDYKFRRPWGKDPNLEWLQSLPWTWITKWTISNTTWSVSWLTSINNMKQSIAGFLWNTSSKLAKAWNEDFLSDSSITKYVDPKTPFINKQYVPVDLKPITSGETISVWKSENLRQGAWKWLQDMALQFNKDTKWKIKVVSSYRSYQYQAWIEARSRDCVESWLCSKAWFSEHQTWLAVDLFEASDQSQFMSKYSSQYVWLKSNAYKYWFTQSYQKWISVDGYNVEPWHWRYVWVDLATRLFNNNQTFAEYKKWTDSSKWKSYEQQ